MTVPPLGIANKRVLIVEDNEDLRDVMASTLKMLGYDTAAATNGRDALEQVAAQMPDLILLDMRMPVMDGWRFAAELRGRHRVAPEIVVVTAAPDARRCAEEIGAAAWLCKPFELDDLLTVMRERLAG